MGCRTEVYILWLLFWKLRGHLLWVKGMCKLSVWTLRLVKGSLSVWSDQLVVGAVWFSKCNPLCGQLVFVFFANFSRGLLGSEFYLLSCVLSCGFPQLLVRATLVLPSFFLCVENQSSVFLRRRSFCVSSWMSSCPFFFRVQFSTCLAVCGVRYSFFG